MAELCLQTVFVPELAKDVVVIGQLGRNPVCTYKAVLVVEGEANAWQELGNMSIENANVISGYVALVWAVAWGFRAIRSSISNYESKENE